jgi:hypothetical protein
MGGETLASSSFGSLLGILQVSLKVGDSGSLPLFVLVDVGNQFLC